MKNEIVLLRSRRILRKLANYHELLSNGDVYPILLSRIFTQDEEKIIGLYENIPGERFECIVITNFGLHIIFANKTEFIGYNLIKTIKISTEKDRDYLIVYLVNGKISMISVKGGRGKFRDAFEFLHFLDRVVADVNQPVG